MAAGENNMAKSVKKAVASPAKRGQATKKSPARKPNRTVEDPAPDGLDHDELANTATAAGKKLVVVESPAKAKTINRYLGREFVVRASMGHVRDLPEKKIGVDIENDFAPAYEPLASRRKVLTELKQLARKASEVFLATDLDREGEAIAWHLAESLGVPASRIQRVIFNEITKNAIQAAFDQPRQIDMNKVNAQQARRILDRIVGYEVSPLLWRKVATGLSAGRVQSVAVRLIVEREQEIGRFMPEEYWKIAAVFTTNVTAADSLARQWAKFLATEDVQGNGPTRDAQQEFLSSLSAFRAELVQVNGKKWSSDNDRDTLALARALGLVIREQDVTVANDPAAKGPAQRVVTVTGHLHDGAGKSGADKPTFTVRGVNKRESRTRPMPPLTTAALQQAASVQLRFSASRTMRIAQQLYEGVDVPGEGSVGLITYMRTDSTNLSNEAVTQARRLIEKQFGPAYLPENPNRYASGERAQEAHEAIRPTDAARSPQNLIRCLSDEQYKLYDLIWKRFVACQMTPAVWNVTEADIVTQTAVGEVVFKAMGRQLAFDGFLRVTGLPKTGDQLLPPLTERQPLAPVSLSPTQHFTQPPPRYTEASLVKALEAENIGRPSTYAAIIQTIQDRGYVELLERTFHPTVLGTIVTQKLTEHFNDIFNVRFTAQMEDKLDKVEEESADWVRVLREFYGPFHDTLEKASREMVHAKAETEPSEYVCEKCSKPMVYRFSKNGRYLACTGYPECKQTYPVDRDGKKVERVTTDIACPACSKPMIVRRSRFGEFLSCSGYPQCQGSLKLDKKGFVKAPTAPALSVDVPCPKCQAPLLLRRSKRGPWLSCSKYPKCRGRAGWGNLDDAKKVELETLLANHEAAHPTPTLRKTDGSEITGLYNPATGESIDEDTVAAAGPKDAGVNCPKCGKNMVIRTGKRGEFLACTGYPRCRNALPLEQLNELKQQQT